MRYCRFLLVSALSDIYQDKKRDVSLALQEFGGLIRGGQGQVSLLLGKPCSCLWMSFV
jgi:hypothetical protein